MGGAPVLDCRRSLVLHNNQQNDGVGGRGALERRRGWGGTCGEDVYSSVLGNELRVGKMENRESKGPRISMASCWMEGMQQPTKSRPTRIGYG
jgi:hypothetical protein